MQAEDGALTFWRGGFVGIHMGPNKEEQRAREYDSFERDLSQNPEENF